jgi:FkbM family methyltransferase
MLYNLLKLLVTHPLNSSNKTTALLRFLRWQIAARINLYPIVYPFTENSKLIIAKGMTGATGNLYCGLHEFYDMGFLLHFLRDDDVFVDVGANIGSYTILASAEIGAKSISIEPVPLTFCYLKDNIALNNIGNLVEAHNVGLAGSAGSIKFTGNLDTVNHVATNDDKNVIEVQVNTLDCIVNTRNPCLIKIDVEGYESEVLKGACETLINPSLKALIVELNGSGERYGYDDDDVHKKIIDSGFSSFEYDPFSRVLSPIRTYGNQNTIYIRDIDFVKKRISEARKININDFKI